MEEEEVVVVVVLTFVEGLVVLQNALELALLTCEGTLVCLHGFTFPMQRDQIPQRVLMVAFHTFINPVGQAHLVRGSVTSDCFGLLETIDEGFVDGR